MQFGGYPAGDGRQLSRGQTLHERTIGWHGNTLVLIGWPASEQSWERLAAIRRAAERFGFRHKYHQGSHERDRDAYLVVGELCSAAPAAVATLCLDGIRRDILAVPNRAVLSSNDITLVEYEDARLPEATSCRWPLVLQP